ncbi:hypothetical protein EAO70_31940 [Streptomyces sp. adm13(2018)]|uniref:phage baseplate protein n=1 Tax=Streptomyces sp. adm13(2018) TaxID=2479007 RepID=UPI0011CE0E85|nr:hypothetical protein [Streptomyces sp. adm13(2018)]TXS11534.1 hypothetical protein EAO70_31940 [Streptomyces sp. adm13(2018)]
MAHSDLIDLTGPWGRILSGTPLNHETHTRAGQSMAVDPVTHELFVVQVRGVPTDGDLCVYRMDRRTGRPIDTMHLTGFGHGNQIGAQHLNGTTHLWTDAGPLLGDYGTRVARVPYRPGQTLTPSSPGVTTPFRPTPDAEQSSPNVDPVYHRLTVRYITGAAGKERVFFRQYPIDPVTGDVTWTATRTIELPLGGFFVNHKTPTPQGFASLGEYLYGMCIEPMGDEARLLFGFSGSLTTPREATICFLSTDAPVQGVKLLTDWTALTGVSGATPQTGVMSPRGRLVSLAGTTFLQLRGGFDCDITAEGPFAQLPPTLTPSRTVRAEVTRNNQGGRCVCRVEVDSRGRLSVFGPTADNRITWIGLDNFSAAWR